MIVGAITGALTFLIIDLTFLVVDNVWLDIVSRQADKIYGFQHSGLHSMREYINSTFWRGTVIVIPVAAIVGAACGALGGAVARLLQRQHATSST